MSYFDQFPITEYSFSTDGIPRPVQYTNLTVMSSVIASLADDQTTYQYFTVRNGERADIVSQRLYGTVDYYWTFYLLNEDIRHCGWPLSEDGLRRKLEKRYPGECLTFLPQDEVDLGNDTNWSQHALIEQFPVGTSVYGSQSGAIGVVYARNVNLGQLFVTVTSVNGFQKNEVITDSLSSPNYNLTCRIVNSPAYLATHHFEDGDGDHVDVDYALDFRGRGSELVAENVSGLPAGSGPGPDGNYIGGVVGDLENPDAYADGSPYTEVTHKEFWQGANDDLSRIKVFRPRIVAQASALIRKSIKANG